MGQQGSCAVAERGATTAEAAILSVLLDSEGGCIWSVEELVRELSAPRVEVLDGLASLQGSGLVHRCGQFAFATRAAWSFDQLDL